MADKKKHTFLCKRFPELSMVYKPAVFGTNETNRLVRVSGAKSLGFRRTPIGGMFTTTDDAVADFIRGTPMFEEGVIVELDEKELSKALDEAPLGGEEKVVQGGLGSNNRSKREESSIPTTAQPPAHPVAARTGGLGRQS